MVCDGKPSGRKTEKGINMTLYDRIISLCESRGIKGGKMCTDIGVSKSLLTELKKGRKTGMSAVTAQKVASYFGVSVGYLLGEEDMPQKPAETAHAEVEAKLMAILRDEVFVAMFDDFRVLDEKKRKIITDLAHVLAETE